MLTPISQEELLQAVKLAEAKTKEKKEKIHLTPSVAKEHLKQQVAVGVGSAVGAGVGFGVKEMLRGKRGDPKEVARVMELIDRQIDKRQKKLEALSQEGLQNSFHDGQSRKKRGREQDGAQPPGPGGGGSPGPRTNRLPAILSRVVRSAAPRKSAVDS